MKKIIGMFFAVVAISAAAAYEPLSQRPVPQSDDPNGWWQKRFAEICREVIVPAIRAMAEKEAREDGKNRNVQHH